MNIEQILEMNGGKKLQELIDMPDSQLLEYFKPMLPFTRPELAAVERHKNPEAFGLDKNGKAPRGSKIDKAEDDLSLRAKNLAKQFGLDLGLED